MRISSEETFPGRCSEAGDELGSRIVSARLVRELMRLCFMLARKYIPYGKWLGTTFSRLECGPALSPIFKGVLASPIWQEREKLLCQCYEAVARMHNILGITEYIEPAVSQFYGRPYLVLNADRFATATLAAAKDAHLKALGSEIGSVDQFDGSDATTNPRLTRRLKTVFE